MQRAFTQALEFHWLWRRASAAGIRRDRVYFKMSPRFWMNLQTEYDMRVPARELTGKLAPRTRVHEPETS
jgi:plasmid maintenance system antidote protein VapI